MDINLKDKSDFIRKEVIRIAFKHKLGHLAPSLSCIDILVTLHYSIMKDGDNFILSKGHGCYGLYAILADKGIIDRDIWETFRLSGCVERGPGILAGTGSLGHGLPMAVGLAYSKQLSHKSGRVFCLLGDGEMQEGSNWEAIQFSVKHKLGNLFMIVDCNGLMAMEKTDDAETIRDRLIGFGVCVEWSNPNTYSTFLPHKDPKAILISTIKGKGLPCMEGIAKWHYRLPHCASL
jgi:transketolase